MLWFGILVGFVTNNPLHVVLVKKFCDYRDAEIQRALAGLNDLSDMRAPALLPASNVA